MKFLDFVWMDWHPYHFGTSCLLNAWTERSTEHGISKLIRQKEASTACLYYSTLWGFFFIKGFSERSMFGFFFFNLAKRSKFGFVSMTRVEWNIFFGNLNFGKLRQKQKWQLEILDRGLADCFVLFHFEWDVGIIC